MDWTPIILGALGIAGTLGGVWLGRWLEDRHRHDSVKRAAYAEYLTLSRAAETSLRTLVDTDERHDPVASTWADQTLASFSVVQIVGSPEVVDAARALAATLSTFAKAWLADSTPEILVQRSGAADRLMTARSTFVKAARDDLGVKA